MTDTPRDDLDEDAFDDIEEEADVLDSDYEIAARSEAVVVDTHDAPLTPTVVKRGVGLPIVLGTAILAALAGAAGGFGLTATFPPVADTSDDLAELRAELSGLDASADLAALDMRLEAVETRRAPRVDLTPLEARLDALEARPEIAPDLTEPVANDSVDESDNAPARPSTSPTPALTPALARRLSQIERRVAALEDAPAPQPITRPAPEPVAEAPETAEPTSRSISLDDLPAYPLAAVEAAIADAEPSRFRRMLRVRDRDTVNALADLEMALESDDLSAALAAHGRLPDAAQAEAADWERRARAALRE